MFVIIKQETIIMIILSAKMASECKMILKVHGLPKGPFKRSTHPANGFVLIGILLRGPPQAP